VVYTALVVGLVVAILVIAFAVSGFPNSSAGSSTSTTSPGITNPTNSVQAENQTYVATLASTTEGASTTSTTFASLSSSTSSTSSTSAPLVTSNSAASTTESQNVGDSYSYTSSSQIEVLLVAATASGGQGSEQVVSFRVQYENIGTATIYVPGGGNGLVVDSMTGTAVVQKVPEAQCEIEMAPFPLTQGETTTAFTPGCWNGFGYSLLQGGSLDVQFTLSWYPSSDLSGQKATLQISAEFYLD